MNEFALDVLEFYKSPNFVPDLPDEAGFRHFRFKLADGFTWRKVPVKINSVEDLKKWVLKLQGVDLYYSTSKWLNPHKISAKGISGNYKVADNLLIGSDLVFDIDASKPLSIKTLDLARKSTNNLYEGMKAFSKEYRFKDLEFTGGRGFRLIYEDKSLNLPANPSKRIEHTTNRRKIFIEELLRYIGKQKNNKKYYKIKTFFDQKITENVMAVIRIKGSAHSKTGLIDTTLPTILLKKSAKEILTHIPSIGKKRLGIPEKGNDNGRLPKKDRSAAAAIIEKEKDVTSLASFPFNSSNHSYFITNRVIGTKGFIPIFIYEDVRPIYKKELEKLQLKFKLGDLYLFQSGNKMVAISLKIVQKRQLIKILNESRSRTKHDFIRHGRIFAPMFMTKLKTINGSFSGQMSKGHAVFVSPKKNIQGNFGGNGLFEVVRGDNFDV